LSHPNKHLIDVVDEQAEFIIVNKPANVGFHDEDNELGYFNQVKSALSLTELYPVHRLDKMTSGLLICAKTKSAAKHFQCLFEQKEIEKFYLAICDKKPLKKQGLIKGDMEKSRRGMWKLLRSQKNPAITQFFSYTLTGGRRLFLVKPNTGKTHQIRVALNSLGSPIIGDPNYYGTSQADRGYLHAYALSFDFNNNSYRYVMPAKSGELFAELTTMQVLENLTTPWSLTWPMIK